MIAIPTTAQIVEWRKAPADGALQCEAGHWTPVDLAAEDERGMREQLSEFVERGHARSPSSQALESEIK